MSYISSNNNRWYTQLEASYGQVPAIVSANRFPAVSLTAQQKVETPSRQDKTGTRTFSGALANMRKSTQFDLTTYMTSWTSGSMPGYGPLFQAALGASPLFFAGGTATAASTASAVDFASPHGLVVGQAITYQGEMRFVSAVVSANNILLSAPFSNTPNGAIGQTVSFFPATELPSVSIFDYWDPSAAVQRLLCGCAIDQLSVSVNSNYQQFQFKGMAQDVVDSASFTSGSGQLTAFPAEPVLASPPTTIVPGHLGQVWLGNVPSRFYTLTSATVGLKNNLAMRTDEFGSILPRAVNPGARTVILDMELFAQDDSATVGLYQAARERAPIVVGFQMGQTAGQLLGVFMQSVVPELPQYNDKDSRLIWQLKGSQAQGLNDSEITVAFG
jgi:hypothetical protein